MKLQVKKILLKSIFLIKVWLVVSYHFLRPLLRPLAPNHFFQGIRDIIATGNYRIYG
jgi:hypothetical protein